MFHQHNTCIHVIKAALKKMPRDAYKAVMHADKKPVGLHEGCLNAYTTKNVNDGGKKVILPSTFSGSRCHMHENNEDMMAYVRNYERPYRLVTFICNPK
jgi:hypothetical protein